MSGYTDNHKYIKNNEVLRPSTAEIQNTQILKNSEILGLVQMEFNTLGIVKDMKH